MTIRGEILSVATDGESLRLDIQGNEDGAAAWRPMNVLQVRIADNSERRRAAFYVGRKVKLTLETEESQ